jgi:hypothetical protein
MVYTCDTCVTWNLTKRSTSRYFRTLVLVQASNLDPLTSAYRNTCVIISEMSLAHYIPPRQMKQCVRCCGPIPACCPVYVASGS